MLTWPNTEQAATTAFHASPKRITPIASRNMYLTDTSFRFYEGPTRCTHRPSRTVSNSADKGTEGIVSKPEIHSSHVPVMTKEVVNALKIAPGNVYVDCNVGEGGHAEALLHTFDNVSLLGIDLDAEALEVAERRLKFSPKVILVQANFSDVASIASTHGLTPVDGLLFDLGVSSRQLDTPRRGFSFRYEAIPDMRFGTNVHTTASHIVNEYSERKIAAIIREFGEEPRARAISRAIVMRRPIESTTQLADVITTTLGRPTKRRIHPATRTFQALRIAVNSELDSLRLGLEGAVRILRPGGRLVVISYHSLEDRLVKDLIRREASTCICPPSTPLCICGHKPSLRLINRHVITPSSEESRSNPRSRSAKMRIAERV